MPRSVESSKQGICRTKPRVQFNLHKPDEGIRLEGDQNVSVAAGEKIAICTEGCKASYFFRI